MHARYTFTCTGAIKVALTMSHLLLPREEEERKEKTTHRSLPNVPLFLWLSFLLPMYPLRLLTQRWLCACWGEKHELDKDHLSLSSPPPTYGNEPLVATNQRLTAACSRRCLCWLRWLCSRSTCFYKAPCLYVFVCVYLSQVFSLGHSKIDVCSLSGNDRGREKDGEMWRCSQYQWLNICSWTDTVMFRN